MERTSRLVDEIGSRCPLEIVSVRKLPADALAGCVVVWDVNLADPSVLASVRSKLALAGDQDVQTIFLIDGQSPHESTQAWAFGASVLLARGRAVKELPGHVGRLMAVAVKQALEGALVTLDSAFTATSANKPLLGKKVVESSAVLINVIADCGLNAWLNQAWAIDEQTSQHCLLVAGITAGFAKHFGFSTRDRLDLTHAAMLHDIGKARIPLAILNKPGRLDEKEQAIIRTHPRIGWRSLTAQGYDDKRLLDAVLHHHEHLDGSGYPDGMSGRQIPDFVRIITLCDIFGALVERRPYKRPLEPERALEVMSEMSEKLDPDLLREFGRYVGAAGEIEAVRLTTG